MKVTVSPLQYVVVYKHMWVRGRAWRVGGSLFGMSHELQERVPYQCTHEKVVLDRERERERESADCRTCRRWLVEFLGLL